MTTSYSQAVTVSSAIRPWMKESMIVLGSSIIISLFGSISIPLPFTPVPLSTQGSVILLLSVLLGSRRAPLAVLAYIGQGALGFPVFSSGKAGFLHIAGPTGGYILGYIAAAFIVGYLVERMGQKTPAKIFGALAVGNLVLFFFGLLWLSRFLGWEKAILLGLLPFIIGDALKLLAVTQLLKKFYSRISAL